MKILLVGPSSDVKNFDKKYLSEQKQQGYTLFSFGDSIKWFKETQDTPADFYSFADPNTLNNQWDILNSDFVKENTTLLVPDLYDNQLSNFYKLKYSCSWLCRNHPKRYNEILDIDYNKIFKTYKPIQYTVVENLAEGFTLNLKDHFWLSLPENKKCRYNKPSDKNNPPFRKNFCKLSYILLPLIIHSFKKNLTYEKSLKEIKIIGFGHYDSHRLYVRPHSKGNSSKGNEDYDEFKSSYKLFKPYLINQIKTNNIKILFDGKTSYYHELTNNLN